MKIKIFCLIIIIIFIIPGCSNKNKKLTLKDYKAIEEKKEKEFFKNYSEEDKKLLEIYDYATKLFGEYKYKEAIKELEKINKVKPSFNVIGINVNMLIGRCYEDLGDLDAAIKYYNISNKYFEKSIYDKVYGYSHRNAFHLRLFVKCRDWKKVEYQLEIVDNAIEILNEMYNGDFYKKYKGTKLESELLGRFSSLMHDAILDRLMYFIIPEKGETYDIKKIDKYIIEFWVQNNNLKGESSYFPILFDLLNYKMYDGTYPSDIIWESEVTKMYFRLFCKKKVITQDTLKRLKEVLPRKDIPQSFIDLFKECK